MDFKVIFAICAMLVAFTYAKPLDNERTGKELQIPDDEVLVLDGEPRAPQDDGEMMETANAMVFQPLFAYRKLSAQRRRVYRPAYRPYYGSYYGSYYG